SGTLDRDRRTVCRRDRRDRRLRPARGHSDPDTQHDDGYCPHWQLRSGRRLATSVRLSIWPSEFQKRSAIAISVRPSTPEVEGPAVSYSRKHAEIRWQSLGSRVVDGAPRVP